MSFPHKHLVNFENCKTKFFSQNAWSTDRQYDDGMSRSGSTTNDFSADEIQVVSSQKILLEDGVGDDIPEAEPNSTYSKFCQAITTNTSQNTKQQLLKKADKSS